MNDGDMLRAWMWVALSAGVGVLFGALGREAPRRARALVIGLAFTAAGSIACVWLELREHSLWAFIVAAVPFASLTAMTRDWLRERAPRLVRLGLWLGALGVAALTFALTSRHAESLAAAQAEQERREQLLREELSAIRHVWSAAPERGVAEAASGRLVAWLAGAPRIEIDAGYEQELGDEAAREIPLRVAFLNDSFAPLDTLAEDGVSVRGWRIEVRDEARRVLRAWRIEEARIQPLLPSQRRDFEWVWDGRDEEGTLLAPGAYAYALEVETGAGRLSAELPFEVIEAGPIELEEPDTTTRYIQEQQRMMQWHQTLEEGMRNLQRMPLR